jgi:anti-anti-sigma factor
MSLQIKIHKVVSGVFVIAPTGSIDATEDIMFKQKVDAILKKGPKSIVFDFAGVDFINSSGLGVVLTTQNTLEKSGADFGLSNLQPQVKAVFKTIKALPKQNVFASVEEMDNYLAQIQIQVKENEML